MNGARLREAVAVANIPTLLPVLRQLTGDERWLADPYRPTRPRGLGDNDTAGFPPELQAEVRAAAHDAIRAWAAGAPVAEPEPSPELLVRMLSWCMAEPVPADYAPLLAAELAGVPDEGPAEVPEGFSVLIIGAGVSGIAMAVGLARAGIPYTVVERNATVGGVWWENRYPGAGVDTPSFLYTYSFAPHAWSHFFDSRDEIHAYLEKVADDFDVRRHVRFRTEVLGARWDAAARGWEVDVRSPDGTGATLRASVVVSAVGAFNKPRTPDVDGLDSFPGPVVHTARWPEGGLDLAGKRVAVVGNGASAMQLVPAVAGEAGHVTVFQRSPQWVVPFEKFREAVPEPVRFLMDQVPLYRLWYRLRQAWIYNDRIHDSLQRDPDWPDQSRSINEVNDAHRRFFTRHIVDELGDRQDLLPAVVPDYPPYGKRILLDNGWYRTLTRDDVTLVPEGVAAVRGGRLVTSSGAEHAADVLVLATGFDVVRYLAPMDIRGRDGVALHEVWDGDDARAYLGTAVPGFPNFFCLYGPNTQTGHGGSVMFMVESQVHYLMSLLRRMLATGAGTAECRADVHDAYNDRVDRAHERMVWTHPGMDTYYRNSRGRVVVNNPFRVIDFWAATRTADLADYLLTPGA